MAANNVKGLLSSKTFWFGALFVLTAIANFFGYADYQPDNRVNEIVEIVGGVGVIFLRLKTNRGIKGLL